MHADMQTCGIYHSRDDFTLVREAALSAIAPVYMCVLHANIALGVAGTRGAGCTIVACHGF